MHELLAGKMESGDLYINVGHRYASEHEWGKARRALIAGIDKGKLSEPYRARQLLHQVDRQLGCPIAAGSESF
ncbi:MAG: hypothetical protein AAGF57_16530 [Pseudomonadota bacterium]